jgi:hypothetical protein
MDMRMKPLVVTRSAGGDANVVVLETARSLEGVQAPAPGAQATSASQIH